jgi:type I restriction enzyme M protein
MLTWIMFLKFFDDMKRLREEEALLAGEPFRPAIKHPYRWRDWAAGPLARRDRDPRGPGLPGPRVVNDLSAQDPRELRQPARRAANP